jgi:hypothetical protein
MFTFDSESYFPMIQMSPFARLFYTLLFSWALMSCATLTGYQDGKALGKNVGEATISLNLTQSQDYYVAFDPPSSEVENTVPVDYYPNMEFMAKYGVSQKLDISIRTNLGGLAAIGAKYQLIGDSKSLFALGTGVEVGTFSINQSQYNIQVPVFTSIHPSEKFCFYLAPRYIYQMSPIFNDIDTGPSYFGMNGGFLFGTKIKFGLDAGYFGLIDNGYSARLITVGLGTRILFHHEKKGIIDKPKTRKKQKIK